MSDFYLKFKIKDKEFEISTTEENVFNEKVKVFFDMYFSREEDTEKKEAEFQKENIDNYENPENNENSEQTEAKQETLEICDFIQIEEPENSISTLIEEENKEEILEESFEQVLEQNENIPTIEFVEPENKDDEFINFLNNKNPQTPEEYLINTALYYSRYLNIQNFTLKQINSKLVPLKGIAINHKTLNLMIENGYIEPMFDLTGTIEVKEYTLTSKAEYEYEKSE